VLSSQFLKSLHKSLTDNKLMRSELLYTKLSTEPAVQPTWGSMLAKMASTLVG